jgi:hypothetical protein
LAAADFVPEARRVRGRRTGGILLEGLFLQKKRYVSLFVDFDAGKNLA